jgi:FKBP-type peptidyl-prolyl cis-trans isomerase FklB
MKTIFLTAVFSLTATASLFADGANVLSDERARDSYAIGMMLGANFKQQGIDVDNNLVLRGMKDQQSGGRTLLTQQEMQATLHEYQQVLAAKQQKMRAELAAKDKADGEAFLETNQKKPGVITLPDGLQYKVLTDGSGVKPMPADTVTVNYRGTFIDGTEFDSSAKEGHPAQFLVNGVIHGWTEALTQMKVGSKWQLFVPPGLAYGEQARPGIPPNSTLIFEVELLDTKAPPPPASSDIIEVPSADEIKNGAKIQTLKPEDVQKLQSKSNPN